MSIKQDKLVTYDQVVAACKKVFEGKTKDYGTSWRILRLPSLTDQIMIKGQRIKAIQELQVQQVADPLTEDLIGMINYSIIALIQMELPKSTPLSLNYPTLMPYYDSIVAQAAELYQNKNHDYQNAWETMRISSITDIVLMKLLRIKNIEDNQEQLTLSEGVAANYLDIINYTIFTIIRYGREQ